jgi:hypothetical protein
MADTPTLQAVGHLRGDGQWFDAVKTNPNDGDVIVDTGALSPAGEYLVAATGAVSVASAYDFQYRDAANATTLHFVRRRLAAGPEDWISPNKVSNVLLNERFRIVQIGTIVGEVQLSIWIQRVG